MKLSKYIACLSIVTALAVVMFVGCGVDSGTRDGNTPGYTGFPDAGLPGGGTNPGGDPANAEQAESDVFDMVNEERTAAGVNPLSWSDALYELAKAHSNDMCDRGFFSHVNPEGEDPSGRGRAGHAGTYTFNPCVPDPFFGVGENIAMGQTSAQQVMDGWMNSPGHRANILNGSYTHIGVGLCSGCGTHWTQCFGTSTSGGSDPPPTGGGGGGKG